MLIEKEPNADKLKSIIKSKKGQKKSVSKRLNRKKDILKEWLRRQS